jgi:putative ABC transport system permease protein
MNLAAKDIRHSPGRFVLTTLGVSMLLMGLMGMSGIHRGIIADATLLSDRIGADLWIVQRNTRGPFAEGSRIPRSLVHRATAMPGLQDVRAFVFHYLQREFNGSMANISILGLDWPADKGQWLPLVAGGPLSQNHYQAIVDETLGFQIGQPVHLGKESYTVVGITTGMVGLNGEGIALFTVSDAQAIQSDLVPEAMRLEREGRRLRGERSEIGQQQPGLVEQASSPSTASTSLQLPQVSAVIARVRPGYDPQQVCRAILAWDDVSVYSTYQQRKFLVEGTIDKARRQIDLFRALLSLIATVILTLILYTRTLDKLHSIALLKLLGATNRTMIVMILQQALLLGSLAYGLAYVMGIYIFPAFPRRVILMADDLLELALIVVGICLFSTLAGIWKALRVAPHEALAG